jgi:hypothetical protein
LRGARAASDALIRGIRVDRTLRTQAGLTTDQDSYTRGAAKAVSPFLWSGWRCSFSRSRI